jgi:hypothetical protein
MKLRPQHSIGAIGGFNLLDGLFTRVGAICGIGIILLSIGFLLCQKRLI